MPMFDHNEAEIEEIISSWNLYNIYGPTFIRRVSEILNDIEKLIIERFKSHPDDNPKTERCFNSDGRKLLLTLIVWKIGSIQDMYLFDESENDLFKTIGVISSRIREIYTYKSKNFEEECREKIKEMYEETKKLYKEEK